MSNFTWQFPPNEASEIQGPNDAGIVHFLSSRKDSIIRETVQNSLDAQADPMRPVRIKFEITRMATADFAATSLIGELEASANSPHNDDEHSKKFRQGANQLKRVGMGSVDCLKIVDSNTTGADDEKRGGG